MGAWNNCAIESDPWKKREYEFWTHWWEKNDEVDWHELWASVLQGLSSVRVLGVQIKPTGCFYTQTLEELYHAEYVKFVQKHGAPLLKYTRLNSHTNSLCSMPHARLHSVLWYQNDYKNFKTDCKNISSSLIPLCLDAYRLFGRNVKSIFTFQISFGM